MRIGMMTDMYKPYISGVTNYVSLNKKFLELSGNEVFVFTFGDLDYEDDEPNVIRSPGLPVPIQYGGKDFSFGLRYSKQAKELLQSCNVAHVNHPFLSGTLGLSYCRPRNIPIVFTNHTRYDLYVQAYLPQLPEGISRAVLEAYLPTFCKNCDLVIAPSAGLKQVLVDMGVNSTIQVVPNGVDITPYRNQRTKKDRAEMGFAPEDIVLIYVGRLGPEKNLQFLLRSFAGAASAYENLRLVLVGDGPDMDHLQDGVRLMGIADRVEFTGKVPYESTPEYFSMADAFVTASITEVHPLSVIEAMAAGLPVLGIHSPGVGDTVQDGITGFLCHEDLAAYTAKLVRLVTDHDLRRKMSVQARLAAEDYAIERTSQALYSTYLGLVRTSSRQRRSLVGRIRRLFSRKGQ